MAGTVENFNTCIQILQYFKLFIIETHIFYVFISKHIKSSSRINPMYSSPVVKNYQLVANLLILFICAAHLILF